MGSTFTKIIDIPEELIEGAEGLFKTGGESIIYGPQARDFYADPLVPPTVKPVGVVHQMAQNTLLPKQPAEINNFSTSQQYSARFGISANHF